VQLLASDGFGLACVLKHTPGPVPTEPAECAMLHGGCYAFTRQRYLDIGAPWQYLRLWGWAEQSLSLANWLQGGRSMVVPAAVVGHVYRTESPWPAAGATCARRFNQRFCIGAFVDEPEARAMHAHLTGPGIPVAGYGRRELSAAGDPDEAMWEHVEEHRVRTWAEYVKRFVGR
jgi:hypothetical protein